MLERNSFLNVNYDLKQPVDPERRQKAEVTHWSRNIWRRFEEYNHFITKCGEQSRLQSVGEVEGEYFYTVLYIISLF